MKSEITDITQRLYRNCALRFYRLGSFRRRSRFSIPWVLDLIYASMLALVNSCMAEMTIFMPVSGGFVRQAGKWVDEAFG